MYSHDHLTDVCPSLVVTSLGVSPGMGHLLFLVMIGLALHVLDRQVCIHYIALAFLIASSRARKAFDRDRKVQE